jgi:hypothetical protein
LNSIQLYKNLFDQYEQYKETTLNSDLIKHSELIQKLDKLKQNNNFKTTQLGKSVEGREIFSVEFGQGKTKILAWSQMHGDEPTATAALFDILNFFSSRDSFNDFRSFVLSKINFHFIPMLNPDGAEKYKRGNAFNIDINRDALRRTSFESRILWDYAEKLQPDFGFNLHDQNSYYTVGRTNNHAAISLLAPPSNHVKSIDYTREQSMQVIYKIFEALSVFIPGNIARYNDEHEPRSFGDNFVKNKISSILIESGFYKNDSSKNFVRKLNFIALLAAFDTISQNSITKIDHTKYFDIPENQQLLFDLLLRNISIKCPGNDFTIDIGINREKLLDKDGKTFNYKSKIAEIGDLSIYYGIEEYDMKGYEINPPAPLCVEDTANFKLFKNGIMELEILNGFLNAKDVKK